MSLPAPDPALDALDALETPGALDLRDDLHGSASDPAVGSISFLNEVMGRYPDAVSFAPGAPHTSFFEGVDLDRYITSCRDHLARRRGLEPEAARRLLFEYGPSRGIINDIVADALNLDHGLGADPADIVVTVGCQEAMFLTLRALFRGGDDILAVVDPSFVGILGAARLLDIDVVPVSEGTTGVDVAGLRALCATARAAGRRIRALYVAPDFANPSGTRMTLETREELLELAAEEGLLLLEDIAYGFTAAPGDELPPLAALDRTGNVITLGTFAKVCLPGARVGFVVAGQRVTDRRTGAERRLADVLAELKTMVTVNTSPIAQAVVGGLLLEHGGSLVRTGRAKAELYRRNLRLLTEALDRHVADRAPKVTRNDPDGGFFVRLRLPVAVDMALLEYSAEKYGVLWTPMSTFYLDGGGDHELRLSCSYLDPDAIDEGARRLADFLADVAR
ncbi:MULTISPECIES: aminotransferase class I/II-fold pyridoxal phosphate-dependent enzyme [Streptomyces]|uniref:aminotransferase class I/II-fold pyridoxal phosphate-dependent enzyme n=1 Tax=Streptomyces TaxID=1883 RepID=UPI00163BFCEF|nr:MULTISPECIES: PLP-dependent aminotransferase family protein [Streptomyces]MBC2879036.1 PLP-dependent aminotransferase family protein [Streptomyces sp. TYQ1024]UBI36106.1 PLP-dependent aminotransferase family protein [Streptomyces mobaraensis]UKW28701.1 PLP-dependent aminotransferase family protein [Streptomyces sp. TYQ1024]